MNNRISIPTNTYLQLLFMVPAICLLGFTGCSSVDPPAGKHQTVDYVAIGQEHITQRARASIDRGHLVRNLRSSVDIFRPLVSQSSQVLRAKSATWPRLAATFCKGPVVRIFAPPAGPATSAIQEAAVLQPLATTTRTPCSVSATLASLSTPPISRSRSQRRTPASSWPVRREKGRCRSPTSCFVLHP